jgi:hypothetical protein
LTWAAAWLYKATDDPQFLDEAEHHYMKFRLKERPNEFFYNKKVAGVQVCGQYMQQLYQTINTVACLRSGRTYCWKLADRN